MRTVKEDTIVCTLWQAVGEGLKSSHQELSSRALIKSSPLPPRLHKILVSSSTVNAY
jgi:hypothetical protein